MPTQETAPVFFIGLVVGVVAGSVVEKNVKKQLTKSGNKCKIRMQLAN